MAKIDHPWQVGPTELIEFALERMHKGSDFDRRLAFLILDVGVETLFKTFLNLPDGVMQFQIKRSERVEASQGNFHELLRGVQSSNPKKAVHFNFAHIEHYHGLRNTLYHLGNQVTAVPMAQLQGYATLAVDLLREYLDVDLSANLVPPEPVTPVGNDPVIDSVEFEIAMGRYRLERLKSHTIQVVALNTSLLVTPVKPFLRNSIEELSLPVDLLMKSGSEKNTQVLGKDVIDILKPSAWHGWVAGQKIQKDKLVAELTGRIREGKADQKNWATVDFIRGLTDEVLIFEPVGKGWGNSPFNLNCWHTLNDDPIKKP
jgi:hypothetical protein